MNKSCLIYGAAGHARVAAEVLQQSGWHIAAFLDDNPTGTAIGTIPIRAYDPVRDKEVPVLIGIGSNETRKRLAAKTGCHPGVVVHPAAVVAADVTIGEGSIILANAVVQTGARIGKHVIINANVCVDHDVVIEDYVHVYPNSYIGGAAVLKAGVTVPPGSVIPRQAVVENGI